MRISFSVDKACNVFGCYTNTSAEDNYSLYASTSSGGKYLRYDGSTYNSYIPSAQVGERIDAIITPNGTSGMPTDSVITPTEFEAAADLCIGTTSTSASSSKLDGNIWGSFVVDGRLTLIPCERLSDNVLGYYDPDSDTFYEPVGSAPTSLGVDSSHLTALSVVGAPEVLTVGEQTATVENLFAVDDIKDEQNIVSGTVTRRCEAVISDGTTPSGRYIGEVGEGNIIVKVRETGYEGDVATFEADRAEPLNGLTVNVEPIQDLHGYDSPWPGGGGKNLFQTTATSKTKSGVTWTVNNDGSITVTGTATGYTDINAGEAIVAGLSETVTVYGDVNASGNIVFGTLKLVDANNQTLETIYNGGTQTTHAVDLTQYSNAYKIVVTLKRNNNVATSGTYHIQVVKGTIVPAWTPYSNICPISGRTSATIYRSGADTSNPTTYTIQLGDTVYGGTLDVTQGKMVVDKVMYELQTVGENNWTKSSSYPGGFFTNYSRLYSKGILKSRTPFICSHAKTVVSLSDYLPGTCYSDGSLNVRIMPAESTTTEWQTYLNEQAALGTPVTICGELVTPIEITLTPTQIEMLLGENNLWSDAGSVKAYVADGDVIEHVTAQPLKTAEGSNTVSVTSAVDPVQLEIDYYKDE